MTNECTRCLCGCQRPLDDDSYPEQFATDDCEERYDAEGPLVAAPSAARVYFAPGYEPSHLRVEDRGKVLFEWP